MFSSLALFLTRFGMRHQWRNLRFYAVLCGDSLLFVCALVAAYLCRFEFKLAHFDKRQILSILPYLVPMKLVVFAAFGLYRGMWRYTNVKDFWKLAQASFVSMLLAVALVAYLHHFVGFSRAVFLLDGLFTFLLTGALRIAIRSYYEGAKAQNLAQAFLLSGIRAGREDFKKVLLIGAGDAGEKILREVFENPHLHFEIVGILDDDLRKQGYELHGVPVLGPVNILPETIQEYGVHQVFVATPSASGAQLRRIVEICKQCDVHYKTLPGIGEIIDGTVSIKALRDVNYQDLLGRPPVKLDTAGIRDFLSDRVVLITGCGGSIGSELCRQVVRYNPRTLVLVDANEANVYQIQLELRHELHFEDLHAVLAHVQEPALIEKIFQKFQPHVVLHAAAYKHVPLLETNPWEAVFNNIMGSRIVMDMAVRYRVGRFVLVSTDKAVRPTNVMGASKRVTELLMQFYQGHATRFMAVRFGNVVGSSGSVIPIFRRQIEQGGPVTVTHPEVTRYFMTIPEAAQLILQAGAMGQGGEIFILEMGTPVKIADMARDLIRLSSSDAGKNIEVIYTGLRPGEKLCEELITVGEGIVSTQHEKIMVLRSNGSWNGWSGQEQFGAWLEQRVEELCRAAERQDGPAIKEKLQEIVPEYNPQETASML
jgi:FlaA1/EpsC-like NDP-sugar epimerase